MSEKHFDYICKVWIHVKSYRPLMDGMALIANAYIESDAHYY